MRTPTPLALALLTAALGLGMLGAWLFDGVHWGLNVPLFTALLASAFAALVTLRRHTVSPDAVVVAACAFVWTLVIAWRDSVWVQALACAGLALTLYLAYLKSAFASLWRVPLAGALRGLAQVLRAAWRAPQRLLRCDVPRALSAHGGTRIAAVSGVGRGLLLSLPLILVFGALLVSADARFEHVARALLDLDFAAIVRELAIFGACFWGSAFVLRTTVWRRAGRARSVAPYAGAPRATEVVVVLAVLDVLFLLFVAAQWGYFFGGDALARAPGTFSYADYARRGFFELVAVAALVLVLLLTAIWLGASGAPALVRAQRGLAVLMVLLVAVIELSAAHRMQRYIEVFGLTELRLFTSAFMLWLLIVLAWFCATVLRGVRERFTGGACLAALAAMAVLVLANPDALIARTNLARAAAGAELDVAHLLSLSADALPAIMARRRELPREDRLRIDNALFLRTFAQGTTPWQGWNWSQRHAAGVFAAGVAQP